MISPQTVEATYNIQLASDCNLALFDSVSAAAFYKSSLARTGDVYRLRQNFSGLPAVPPLTRACGAPSPHRGEGYIGRA
jgi:hypothetical protein